MSDTSVRFPGVLSFFLRVFDLRPRPSGSPRADILFGLTAALALVPEAVAFAFLAGVPPLVGLYAAFVLCLIMVVVSVYTVLMHDLAPAVILGVALSALVFSWNKSKHLLVDAQFNEYGAKIYQLHGVLFFGSVARFKTLFCPQDDPDVVVIDFYFSRVYDQSALEAINTLADRYEKLGKKLHLRHLSEDCRHLLHRAGDLVEVNISEDPHYHVATDHA